MSQREDVHIPSDDERLAAYVYRPEGANRRLPCVVMAHGFSGTRDDGLPAYAEAFRAAGYAVVLFDYRHFGASSGQPRQLLDIDRQIADYRAVVEWARQLDEVDPERIVLWGTSFSGGHVLEVAATDPRIAAVIAQVPFTDGIPTLMASRRWVPLKNVVRLVVAGLRDQVAAWRGRPPHLVPAFGDPGTLAAITAPDAKLHFEALVSPKGLWRNEVSAAVTLRLSLRRPGLKASRLAMPLLVCVSDSDSITPAAPAVKAAQRAPRGELRRYACTHFELYLDAQVKADEIDFLQRAVPGVVAPS
ncbi:alpha/beta hydrolase [Mycobacterium intermedium]|uniref:Alpha/beta hydrolase n=1 Tax=Mycobacterium intermedium TaxID=28445 RepID=A0A1E3S4K1_MYCIE|nr:alpha/beta fold hydrolase [Mycobacterium intermedium]MCV6964583.1 alpha/beta fold hydrolase [Mycobacterium intermedium]ODQ97086.1 alpha/beta hydrolase [Mycobacterium intermedium]OPE46796.1 alpha/beta hydrolase [Mycobacterium intermedium]ORA97287.1 alpha/beta hydrolase [Mycobacterium intermedium]